METTSTAWPMFPCCWIDGGECSCGKADCGSPGKHPLTGNGLKDATTDAATIERWRAKWPKANWAIRTGDGLAVIDIDRDKGGFDSLLALEEAHGRRPQTAEVITGGGGRHLYFVYPKGEKIGSRNGWRPGIDVKADGGYVIAAGSNHKSGNLYQWDESGPDDIVVAPDWLLAILPHKGEPPKPETNGPAANGHATATLLQRAQSYVAKAAAAGEGQRNDAAFRLAGSVAAIEGEFGERLAESDIFTLLTAWNLRNAPPLADGELRQCVQSALRNGTARPAKPQTRRSQKIGSDTTGRRLTDVGNCERFAEQHGGDVRYCHLWGKWLVWGNRWQLDTAGEIERRARQTARSIYSEAAAAGDKDDAEALAKWAVATEKRDRLAAMIALAQSEYPIPIAVETLDSDGWLFNVENGTIDLRTGELREHRREDYITKIAPVEYPIDGGKAKLWLSFLDRIFDGNQELVRFIQRLLGMTLAGEVLEHTLPILWGVGANGKSVFVETWCGIMGPDYSMFAQPTLLMVDRWGRHPTERADLAGKRLVVINETGEGNRLSESTVKQLTSREQIRARRMREDAWQFTPQHSILLVTNHRPEVRGTDHGIWRRLRLVPFNVVIPPSERDEQLANKLRSEYPAILRWAVEGCLEWQRIGLAEPEGVQLATNEYRAEQDHLAEFLAERCVIDPTAEARASDLFASYKKWAEDRGEKPGTQKRFGNQLVDRGFTSDRPTSGPHRFKTIYRGIGLLALGECA